MPNGSLIMVPGSRATFESNDVSTRRLSGSNNREKRRGAEGAKGLRIVGCRNEGRERAADLQRLNSTSEGFSGKRRAARSFAWVVGCFS